MLDVALPLAERPARPSPRQDLVEPRIERAPPPKKPRPQQPMLDLTPNDQYHLPPTDLLKPAPPASAPELDSAALEQRQRLRESITASAHPEYLDSGRVKRVQGVPHAGARYADRRQRARLRSDHPRALAVTASHQRRKVNHGRSLRQ